MKKITRFFNFLKRSLLSRMVYSIFYVGMITTACVFISQVEAQTTEEGLARLQAIHSKLTLIHGNFSEEFPEQLMAAMFLPSTAKVLELGGNVGRNSCIIGSILEDSRNLVTMEPEPPLAQALQQNRDINHLQFHIEQSAISNVRLIQREGKTIPSDIDLPGYSPVNIVTFNQLQKKYHIKFDTLVVDCEGALYYILRETPEMLRNIRLIIIENDFDSMEQMLDVQKIFKMYGFQCVYNQSYTDSWRVCGENFFQVWKR